MPYATLPSKGSFARYWSWIFLNRVIHELPVSPSDGRYVSVIMPSMSWLGWLIEEPADLASACSRPSRVSGSEPTLDTTMVGEKPSFRAVSLNSAVYAGTVSNTTTLGLAAAMAVTWAVM